MALKYTLVDVIPNGDSGESVQNSEPSVTLDPLNPSQLIAGAFGATGSDYFVSTDGGVAWSDYGNLASNDKSLAWLADGSAALTVSLTDYGTTSSALSTYSGTTSAGNFGSAINVFEPGVNTVDQPWIATGPNGHIYVAYNNLGNSGPDAGGSSDGKTASVLVSADGGNNYTPVTLDRVGTTFQDDPSVRVAVNGSTVYAVFVRWNSSVESDSRGNRYNSQVIVERSDNGGTDGFTALGSGGNGVQVATPIDVFTPTGGSVLSVGKERIAAEVAIAVDPGDPNRVLVAYQDAPGADGLGQVQLVLAESTDGGATWSTKFTTSSSTRSGQPAIAILGNGAVGFLYDSYSPATNELSQHFLTTTNDFATTSDTVLATETNATPSVQFQPYVGDFFDLTSLGNTFYGTFCASNADDGTDAQFANLTLQRNFTGTMGAAGFKLTDASGNPVDFSIDPYVFSCTLAAPTIAGLSNASYAAFASPVTLSPDLGVDDVSSTTLDCAAVQITDGMFAGDVLAADTNGTAIAASYNCATEVLTLTGSDTLADYAAVLASVTFSSSAADPTNSGNDDTRTVTWSVNDGSFASTPEQTTIALARVPHVPNSNVDEWILRNGNWAASAQPGSIPSGYRVAATGDFNGDRTSDILWQNASTGDTQEWLINNCAWAGTVDLGVHPGNYQIAGVGDFFGDGIDDVLWTAAPDAPGPSGGPVQTDIWELGSDGKWVASVSPGSHPADYNVAGIGDFTGNGTSDMLWQSSVTGDVDEWQIVNGRWAASVDLGVHPGSYRIAGIGDFTGNGIDGVLWTSVNGDGTISTDIWELGPKGLWVNSVNPGTHPAGYQVVGIGDLTGNGTSDILWQNPSTGDVDEWLINNGTWAGSIDLGTHPGNFQLAGVGDFAGNGTKDILWHSPS